MRKIERDVAINSAKEVGEILMRGWKNQVIQFNKKGETEIVTDYDREVETTLVSILQDKFPNYGIISEEGTVIQAHNEIRWILDPIDGTTI
jgi:myo-inositol-1(or 4)-monophosphatase